jgi:hypothetical protein
MALLAACSGESSDEFSNTLDSGGQVGEGDAGGDPRLDGGPGEPLDAGLDAGLLPDAAVADGGAEPTRSDVTVKVAGAALTRCGSTTVEITWKGDLSFPGLTVSGLPAGVSYEVSEHSDGKAKVVLTADNAVALGSKGEVTLQLGEGADTVSAKAELAIASTFRVTGKVMNSDGLPQADAQVTLNEDLATDPLTSDASGVFTIEGVSAPYDLLVVPGENVKAIEYRGLTRCDPTIVSVGAPTRNSVILGGTITPPTGQDFAITGDQLLIGGKGLDPAVVMRPSATTSSDFSAFPSWIGESTYDGPLVAVYVQSGPVYSAFGSIDLIAPNGGELVTLSIPLTQTLPTRTHTIRVERGAYSTVETLNLFSFDVVDGHLDALPASSLPALGTLTFDAEQKASLTTTIPAGDTVLAASAYAVSDGSFVTLTSLIVEPAATQADTVFSFPATAPFADLTQTVRDEAEPATTFSWGAILGADAIILDLSNRVRAVLPGTATSYDTSVVNARVGTVGSCPNGYSIQAVFLDGYDPDTDADGTGRDVPREAFELEDGAGHLIGRQNARVYSWRFNNCF